jgi:hypothetical protein
MNEMKLQFSPAAENLVEDSKKRQGTTLVAPKMHQIDLGFSPCAILPFWLSTLKTKN